MKELKLSHLDHVAIRVKNIEATCHWYSKVFGLKIVKSEKWGDFPVFLLAGKTGIAVFPLSDSTPKSSSQKSIDHFAFNVDKENFEAAKYNLNSLDIKFSFQDHYYFHSIYIQDPDGHIVELTTLVVNENEFYQK